MSAVPHALLPLPMRVARTTQELPGIVTLELEPPAPAAFAPGQFQMLYAHGAGEVPISISGGAGGRLLHTVRAIGPVTRALARLSPGDFAGARGPFGNGWPLEETRGKDALFIAGGIGLAPLRPAIEQVLAHRQDYDRVTILYGARSPADILYRADLERWRGRFDVSLQAIVDRAGRDWYGPVGVVSSLLSSATLDPEGTLAMLCGPEIMMRFTARELVALGVSPQRIFLSLERSMKCGVGLCGHCQLGGLFICKDGPVVRWDRAAALLNVREM